MQDLAIPPEAEEGIVGGGAAVRRNTATMVVEAAEEKTVKTLGASTRLRWTTATAPHKTATTGLSRHGNGRASRPRIRHLSPSRSRQRSARMRGREFLPSLTTCSS